MITKNRSVLMGFLVLSVFSVLGLLIYSETFESPFIFDDLERITENHDIRITNLNIESILDAAFGKKSAKARPVGNITFALNYYVHQYNVEGYHIVNIVIHILAGLFLFLFIQTTLNLPSLKAEVDHSYTIAFFTALLWLVHPVQTQSVTYIVQRLNSLAALFYILAFWLYVKGRLIEQTSKKWSWFSGAALAWIFALGCKQNAATLPIFIFLYEWYFFQDFSADWLKRNLKIVLLVVFVFGMVGLLYLGFDPIERLSSIKDFADKEFTLSERIMTQFRVVAHYISLIFFPHPSRLNLDYDFPLSTSLINPLTTLLSLFAIAGFIALAIYLAKKQRLISFCILWFFGNLVIESSIIPLAIIFEHRIYLPSMMVCLIPVVLAYRYIKLDWIKIGLLSALVIGLCVWTYQRNAVWKNGIRLWSDVVKKSPNKARANFNLGSAYSAEERIEAAIPFYLKALEIDPNKPQFYINLGDAMEKQGNADKAFELYKTALKLKPNFAIAHNNLAILLAKRGNTDEAIQHYLDAIKINPYYAEAHFSLASVLVAQGDIEAGIDHYLKALQLQPDYTEAHNNLGGAFAKLGRNKKAIVHYTAALKLDPSMAEAHNNLGIAFMQESKIEDAINHFRKALQIRPDFKLAASNLKRVLSIREMLVAEIARLKEMLKDNPDNAELHFLLGNMYLQIGNLQQAIDQYNKVLQQNPKFLPALNNLALVRAANNEYYKALTVFLDVLELSPEDAETHYNIACMYGRLKRVDESIEWLQRAIDKGYVNWESIKFDSDLDNIRDALAYKELVKGH